MRSSPSEVRRRKRAAGGVRASPDAGFTLLELLVVLGILAMLATVAGPQVLRYMGRAKVETARAQISSISTALELYSLDNGGFPPQQQGLVALVRAPGDAARWRGPYLKRSDGLNDPWGRPYEWVRALARLGAHVHLVAVQPPEDQALGALSVADACAAFEVFTLGRDNAPGGAGEDQDIVSW